MEEKNRPPSPRYRPCHTATSPAPSAALATAFLPDRRSGHTLSLPAQVRRLPNRNDRFSYGRPQHTSCCGGFAAPGNTHWLVSGYSPHPALPVVLTRTTTWTRYGALAAAEDLPATTPALQLFAGWLVITEHGQLPRYTEAYVSRRFSVFAGAVAGTKGADHGWPNVSRQQTDLRGFLSPGALRLPVTDPVFASSLTCTHVGRPLSKNYGPYSRTACTSLAMDGDIWPVSSAKGSASFFGLLQPAAVTGFVSLVLLLSSRQGKRRSVNTRLFPKKR